MNSIIQIIIKLKVAKLITAVYFYLQDKNLQTITTRSKFFAKNSDLKIIVNMFLEIILYI